MPRSLGPRYWIEKKAQRKSRTFPVGTIAYYGPDDRFASKVVAGILLHENDEDVTDMRTWFCSEGVDVRLDMQINQEILDFLDQYQVGSVGMMDRIIGCPHQEGIDYPEGEKCPQCPFWANRERWTGEIIS